MIEQPKTNIPAPGELEPRQRQLLEDVILRTTKKILDFTQGDIPDCILPETSGRLSEVLIVPLLQAIADMHNLPHPEVYHFMSASSKDEQLRRVRELEQAQGKSAEELLQHPERLIAYEGERFEEAPHRRLQYAAELDRDARKQAETIRESRAQAGRKNQLIILDHMVGEGTTANEINRAFQTSDVNRIHTFVSFLFENSPKDPTIHLGTRMKVHNVNCFFDTHRYIRGYKKMRQNFTIRLEAIPIPPEAEASVATLRAEIAQIQQQVLLRLQEAGSI